MKAKKQKKGKQKIRKFKQWFWGLFFIAISFVVLFFYMIAKGWLGFMPSLEELENPSTNLATEVISADGIVLGTYYYENRTNVSYSEISPQLINALIATEDSRFYSHSGIDFKALGRALVGVVTFNNMGGGSTITQQLAKNLFPRGKVNLFTIAFKKFKEWVVAVRLEKNYSKEEILAMYLNTAAFGNNAYGIKAAASIFFSKEPIDLNAEESALLIGLLKGPSYYNPRNHYERAFNRRNVVLMQMNKYNYLTDIEYDSLKNVEINLKNFRKLDHTSGMAKHFREVIRTQMTKWCRNHKKPDGTNYNLYADGLKIYVTIDSRYQKHAEEAVEEYIGGELQPIFFKHWEGQEDAPFEVKEEEDKKQRIIRIMNSAMKRSERYKVLKENSVSEDSINKIFRTPVEMTVFSWNGNIDTVMTPWDSILYHKFFLRTGLMSVDSKTGHVKAYVCAPDYGYFKYDNVTQMRRQVGSTFKPFLYTLAMQEGEMSPCSTMPNVQVTIKTGPDQIWEPRNSTKRIGENVSLKWALAHSNNWISGALIKKYGPEPVIRMARKMGVKSDIPKAYSIALGSADLSLYEMVGAMNTFVNKGVYIEPIFITKITDKNGNILETFVPETKEAMSEETAYLMLALMKGVVESGTGVRIRYKYGLNNPIAGKTGTTQENSDGWFMGLTPDLVTGVWTGCEDRDAHFRTIALGQGANSALPVWAIYMKKLYEAPDISISQGEFEKPINPLSVDIDCEEYEIEPTTDEIEENSIDFDDE